MSVLGYFVRRPRAEIEADRAAAVRDEFEPKGLLTQEEAAQILRRNREGRLMGGKVQVASPDNLDAVLRHHLRVDRKK